MSACLVRNIRRPSIVHGVGLYSTYVVASVKWGVSFGMYLGEAGCSASDEHETMLGCTAWKYDRYDFGSAWLPYSISCTVVFCCKDKLHGLVPVGQGLRLDQGVSRLGVGKSGVIRKGHGGYGVCKPGRA